MNSIIGIDIGCTKMYMLAEHNGQLIEYKTFTGLDCPLDKIKSEILDFVGKLPFKPDGIGIGLVGLVEGDNLVKLSDIMSLTGVRPGFLGELGYPVKFMNDVKAATVCEAANYPNNKTVAVIMAGSGIAVGISHDDKILGGENNFGGELGYCIFQTQNGPQKVDDISGGLGILKSAGCGIEELLEKLASKEPSSMTLIQNAGYHFGLVLTNIIHLFNPSKIVIGGSTSTFPGYMETALKTAKEFTIPDMFDSCEITRPKDEKRIVALGAIEYVRSIPAN